MLLWVVRGGQKVGFAFFVGLTTVDSSTAGRMSQNTSTKHGRYEEINNDGDEYPRLCVVTSIPYDESLNPLTP